MSNLLKLLYKALNKRRKAVLMVIDTTAAATSYAVTYIGLGQHPFVTSLFAEQSILFVAIYISTFKAMSMYENMWRYAGVQDLFQCLKASVVGNILFMSVAAVLNLPVRYSVCMLVLLISSFSTMTVRIVYRAVINVFYKKIYILTTPTNVMLIGAGEAAVMLLEELKMNNPNNYSVKCLIDDDSSKLGRKLNNVPVVGNTSMIAEIAEKYDIGMIIVSIPSVDKENKKRILDVCSKTKCKLKILPEICSLITYDENKRIAENMRDVQLEDLLGREPVMLECGLAKDCLMNKTLLVTGGGGSIGSELCRQIAAYSPKKLIILDEYENNAYDIQQKLIRAFGDSLNIEIEIASVRDGNKLEKIFAANDIDIVFHAAAHKHVPLMEHNPEEAIKNNILGTYNIAWMSDKYKADKFILISTDKAVNPTSIMGASKRVCEMIVQSFAKHSSTKFAAVRFGNVLGSNGSVIPLFIQQIKAGGPVTITHEEITRYFMTIPEAVQLVLKAASIEQGGEVFVLDMGAPVKIKDLAYNLIRLSGLTPEEDIKIVYTGLRPGEKLYEELLINNDASQVKTDIDKIFVEKPLEFDEVEFFDTLVKMVLAAKNDEEEKMISLIKKAVPSYIRTPNRELSKIEKQNENIGEFADDVKIYHGSRAKSLIRKIENETVLTDDSFSIEETKTKNVVNYFMF